MASRLPKNNPAKAGKRASRMEFFGDYSRFAVYAIHTRFDSLVWIVSDAETPDETAGLPNSIVGQFSSRQDALDHVVMG